MELSQLHQEKQSESSRVGCCLLSVSPHCNPEAYSILCSFSKYFPNVLMPHGEKGGLCSLTCLLHVSDLRQVGWDIELGCVFLCSLLLPDCSMFNLVYQTQYFIGPVIYMNFEPMTFGGGGGGHFVLSWNAVFRKRKLLVAGSSEMDSGMPHRKDSAKDRQDERISLSIQPLNVLLALMDFPQHCSFIIPFADNYSRYHPFIVCLAKACSLLFPYSQKNFENFIPELRNVQSVAISLLPLHPTFIPPMIKHGKQKNKKKGHLDVMIRHMAAMAFPFIAPRPTHLSAF